jgi:HEAT repeat protein
MNQTLKYIILGVVLVSGLIFISMCPFIKDSSFQKLYNPIDQYQNNAIRIIRGEKKSYDVIATIKKLSEDENPFIAVASAKSLVKLGEENGLRVLNRLSYSPDLWVQLEVAKAYIELKMIDKGVAILDTLIPMAEKEKKYNLLLEIAQVFLDLRDYKKVSDIVYSEIFQNKALEIQTKRERIIKKASKESVMDAITDRAVDKSKKLYDRKTAIRSILNRISKPDTTLREIEMAKQTLEELVSDPVIGIRVTLAEEIGEYPNPFDFSIDILSGLINDPVPEVYMKAFVAVCKLGRFYDENYLELFDKFTFLSINKNPELIGQLASRDKIKQILEESKKIRELSVEAQRILRELTINEEKMAEQLDEIKVSFNQVAALWIIYGFKKAEDILDEIAKTETFELNLREKAIDSLSYRVDEFAMVRLLALAESEDKQIHTTSINALLKPWWINRIEVKDKFKSLLGREKNLDIILGICQAYIKWGKDYDKSVIQSPLLRIAKDESLDFKFRTRVIELLGELR